MPNSGKSQARPQSRSFVDRLLARRPKLLTAPAKQQSAWLPPELLAGEEFEGAPRFQIGKPVEVWGIDQDELVKGFGSRAVAKGKSADVTRFPLPQRGVGSVFFRNGRTGTMRAWGPEHALVEFPEGLYHMKVDDLRDPEHHGLRRRPASLSSTASLHIQAMPQFWGKAGSGMLVVCEEDHTVLLLLRSRHVEQPGTWGIPGGAVHVDESDEGFYDSEQDENEDFEDEDDQESQSKSQGYTPDQTRASAEKESMEEMGSLPQISQELGTTLFQSGTFTYTTYVIGITAKEKARWTPTIRLNWENIKAQWFPLDKLPPGLHFGVTHIQKNHPIFQGKQTSYSTGSLSLTAGMLDAPPQLVEDVTEVVHAARARASIDRLRQMVKLYREVPEKLAQLKEEHTNLERNMKEMKPGDTIRIPFVSLGLASDQTWLEIRCRPSYADKPGLFNVFRASSDPQIDKFTAVQRTPEAASDLENAFFVAEWYLEEQISTAEKFQTKASELAKQAEATIDELQGYTATPYFLRVKRADESESETGSNLPAITYTATLPLNVEDSRYSFPRGSIPRELQTIRLEIPMTRRAGEKGSLLTGVDPATQAPKLLVMMIKGGTPALTLKEFKQDMDGIRTTIEHECMHVVQILIGVVKNLGRDDSGLTGGTLIGGIPKMTEDTRKKRQDQPYFEDYSQHKIDTRREYENRDVEFYPLLRTDLHNFKLWVESMGKGFIATPQEARQSARDYIKTKSPFFDALRHYDLARWRKAVTEFTRYVDSHPQEYGITHE